MQSQLEEAAESREREKLKQTHQLADTTFRNTVEFMDDMKTLAAAGKAYHKSLEAMVEAADQFYGVLETVGQKAANLPGSIRQLGSELVDVVASYHSTKENQDDWIESLNSDFVIPVQRKIKDEKLNLKRQHDLYRSYNIKRTRKMKSAYSKLKKASRKKNPSREHLGKIMQLNNQLEEAKDVVHTHRVEGLRKALLEERKLYCFCLGHFCSVVQKQISYSSKTHNMFSSNVINWQTACSSPNELPSESTALLTDPRSTRAFPPASFSRNDLMHQGNSMLADVLSPNRPLPRRVSCRVKALYPLQNPQAGEDQLEFKPGDLIDAIDDDQDGWQYGENTRTHKSGWFPTQYVNQIWPPPSSSPQVQRSGSSNSLQRREGSATTPMQMGSSSTEREYIQSQQQQQQQLLQVQQNGMGSRRSSMNSVAVSHRS